MTAPQRDFLVAAAALASLLLTLSTTAWPTDAGAAEAGSDAGISSIPHVKPVPGGVVKPYEPPPQRWLPGHRGVDLAAPEGAPVRASGDGTVHFAGMVAGTPTVSVMHADGIRTTYQPVRWTVAHGQAVSRGDVIGTLGPGPDPGLHWGALRGGDYLNPLDLLGRRPIVLKPQE